MKWIRKRRETAGPGRHWRYGILVASGIILCAVLCILSGCVTRSQNTEKLRDLEFTVLDKDTIPEEFKLLIEENKAEPFKLTYADQGQLYIAEGYGAQPAAGYSVEVTGLYETEDAVCVNTNLLGPEKGEETKEITTYPYVVIQLDYIEKDVLFD